MKQEVLDEVISEIRKARSSHIKWRSYAYGMLSGLDVTQEQTPVDHHECGFGRWYFGVGQKHFGHLDTYEGIEIPHKVLHQVYDRIHALASKGKIDEAAGYEEKLTHLSRQLMEALDLLESEAREAAARG